MAMFLTFRHTVLGFERGFGMILLVARDIRW